jgi:hypothetical protein
MPEEDIIEDPEEGTAGLTSVCQLVDVTDAVSYINNNTSSASEEIIFVPLKMEKKEIEKFGLFKPLERSEKFRKILKRSIEKNRDLLMELSKY